MDPHIIGIAPTKTLANLASHIANAAERKPGSYPAGLTQVCNLGALPSLEPDDRLQWFGVLARITPPEAEAKPIHEPTEHWARNAIRGNAFGRNSFINQQLTLILIKIEG